MYMSQKRDKPDGATSLKLLRDSEESAEVINQEITLLLRSQIDDQTIREALEEAEQTVRQRGPYKTFKSYFQGVQTRVWVKHANKAAQGVAPTASTPADRLEGERSSERNETENSDYKKHEYLNWTPLQDSEQSVTQVLEHMKTILPDSGRISDNAFSGVYHHLVHRRYEQQNPYHDEHQFRATLVRTIRKAYPYQTPLDETVPPPEPSEGEGSTQTTLQSDDLPLFNQAASFDPGTAELMMGVTGSCDAPHLDQGGFLQVPLKDMDFHYTSFPQAYQAAQPPESWAASPNDPAPSTMSHAQQTGIDPFITLPTDSMEYLTHPAISFPPSRHGVDNRTEKASRQAAGLYQYSTNVPSTHSTQLSGPITINDTLSEAPLTQGFPDFGLVLTPQRVLCSLAPKTSFGNPNIPSQPPSTNIGLHENPYVYTYQTGMSPMSGSHSAIPLPAPHESFDSRDRRTHPYNTPSARDVDPYQMLQAPPLNGSYQYSSHRQVYQPEQPSVASTSYTIHSPQYPEHSFLYDYPSITSLYPSQARQAPQVPGDHQYSPYDQAYQVGRPPGPNISSTSNPIEAPETGALDTNRDRQSVSQGALATLPSSTTPITYPPGYEPWDQPRTTASNDSVTPYNHDWYTRHQNPS